MKIVIAPDSFKESMTASEVADAMEKGILGATSKQNKAIHIVKVPLADGGEGTVEVLNNHLEAKRREVRVTGPLGSPIEAVYGLTEDGTAIIEMATAAGLDLLQSDERNPMQTTTYGVGEMMIDALDVGARQFIIGLGGSATNDGGIGMAQALGVSFTDESGKEVPFGGASLAKIAHISTNQIDRRIDDCTFTIASDVDNPLLGSQGATYVYGSQKGATKKMIAELESGMAHYATLLQEQLNIDVAMKRGAGAAGGLGAACFAFLQADVKRGIELVMEVAQLEAEIKTANFVLTGEGKMDDQTMYGKVPFGVAVLAKNYGVPVIAFTGANHVTTDELYDAGITAIFSIMDGPRSLAEALKHGDKYMKKTVENVFRIIFSLTT